MTDAAPLAADSGAPHHGGRRVGPFTLPQWLMVIGGGVGIGLLIKRHQGASGGLTTADLNSTTSPSVTDQPTTVGPDGTVPLVNGAASDTGTSGGAGASTGPTDNQGWRTAALNYLVANGLGSPTDIDQALADYLEGNPLTAQEKAVVNEAIQHVGAPPEFVPAITDAPTAPTPAPVPTPAAPAAPAPPSAPVAPNLTPAQINGIQAYLGAAYNLIARYKNNENVIAQMAALGIKVSDLQNNGVDGPHVQLYKVWCQQYGHADLANS